MFKHLVIACAIALAGIATRAEEAPAAPPAENNAGEAKALVTRDPFWPVGFAPRGEALVSAPAGDGEPKAGLQINNLSPEQQAALGRRLRVSGIMKTGASYLARINNQLVGAGDEIVVDFEGSALTLIVRSISKDSVQIEPKP